MKVAERMPKPTTLHERPSHRFSVDQYLRMIQTGILSEEDKVELLEGHIVPKMPRNPSHDSRLACLMALLIQRLPADWIVRCQSALELKGSVPEPDLCVVTGPASKYLKRHPRGDEVGVVIEVSDSSLKHDREDKLAVYARSAIRLYWVVNLVDNLVEEYSEPRNGKSATYRSRKVHHPADTITLTLGGRVRIGFSVAEILMLSKS